MKTKTSDFLTKCLTIKKIKIMDKKNYEFIAFNGRHERIKLNCVGVSNITEEMAQGIKIGIEIGLAQKYRGAYCRYKEI